jgi:hypothetical protein
VVIVERLLLSLHSNKLPVRYRPKNAVAAYDLEKSSLKGRSGLQGAHRGFVSG